MSNSQVNGDAAGPTIELTILSKDLASSSTQVRIARLQDTAELVSQKRRFIRTSLSKIY